VQRSCWINFANIDPRAYRLQIQPVSPFYLHAHLEKLKQTHFAKVNAALVYVCFPDWLQKWFNSLIAQASLNLDRVSLFLRFTTC